jgi:hypothetical protein
VSHDKVSDAKQRRWQSLRGERFLAAAGTSILDIAYKAPILPERNPIPRLRNWTTL